VIRRLIAIALLITGVLAVVQLQRTRTRVEVSPDPIIYFIPDR
jgi:hypothetical protein